MSQRRRTGLLYLGLTFAAFVVPQIAQAGFTLTPDASQYALLFEGAGGNQLSITNVTINGNVGVGNSGIVHYDGGTTNGRIDFSAAPATPNQFQFSSGTTPTGGVHYNVAAVASALSYVNNLNTMLGGEAGTNITVNGNTTVNAANGTLDANGNRVFTIDSFSLGNGQVLTINGDLAGDSVVFNFSSTLQFHGNTSLVGLSADQVLFNVVGGANLTGGPTLDINNNGDGAHPGNTIQGVFLDPNGAINVTNARITSGRVFGGDTHDFQYVSGSSITASMNSVPEPAHTAFALGLIMAIALVVRKKLIRS